MADLGDRFRSLDRVQPPDLWKRAQGVEPRPIPGGDPSPQRRLVVILVSLALAFASTTFAVLAFQTTAAPTAPAVESPTSAGPRSNGEIYFSVGGADAPLSWKAVSPDGTGQRTVIPADSAAAFDQIAWSPDGSRIAFKNTRLGRAGIYTANPDGSDIRQLTDGINDSWPAWSLDGTRIAFASTRGEPSQVRCRVGDGALCPTDLYVMDADGSNIVRLTNDPLPESDPAWSPDGTRIAFVGTADPPDYRTRIVVMNVDGTDAQTVAATSDGATFAPSWSPDGSRLAYLSIRGEMWWVFVANADGSGEQPIVGRRFAEDPGSLAWVEDAAWSPDGQWIAFTGLLCPCEAARQLGVYLVRPDASRLTKIAAGGSVGFGELAWRPMPIDSTTPTPSASAQVTRTFDVGMQGQVSGLAYGFGSLWVDGYESPTGPGHVIKLDPETGEQMADIRIGPVTPGFMVGGEGSITIGYGSVWVIGTEQQPLGSSQRRTSALCSSGSIRPRIRWSIRSTWAARSPLT